MKDSFQVGLISPYRNLSAIGLRYISAALRAKGWQTRLIFLPEPDELFYKAKPPPQAYPESVLDQVCELSADLDLIGVTVMSNYFGRARSLTQAIHERLSLPVIWGGIHPTVRPAECLQWADFVCVGEGEEAIVDLVSRLAAGQDGTNIPNIWAKDAQGRPLAVPSRPIYQDLDALPLPDYALDNHYILHEERLRPMTPPLLAHYLMHNFARQTRLAYMLSTTRGCPYRCAFCCDNTLANMFPRWRQLRRRSPENLAAEIEAARRLLPQLEAIMFIDSTFLATNTEAIRHFSQVYRRRVGLPFFIQTTPGSIKEDKIRLLVEAGLTDVSMGLQTGSKRVRSLYQRYETQAQVLKAGRLLQKYQPQIPYPSYDIISDNPYETTEDKLETLRLLYQLPRPHIIHFFSLTFYPGTDLYDQAKADGLIQDDERDVYAKSYVKLAASYYNFVLWALHRNWPRWLLWPLIQPFVLKVLSSKSFEWPFQMLYKAVAQYRGRLSRRKHLERTPLLEKR